MKSSSKAAIAALAIGILTFSTAAPAIAAKTPAETSCSAVDAAAGNCLTVVAPSGTKNVLAFGVKQALSRGGDTSAIQAFIAKRGQKGTHDGAQQQLEALAQAAKTPAPPRSLAAVALASAFASPRNPGGLGTISDNTLTVEELMTYFNCTTECVQVGTLQFQFVMTINSDRNFSLNGQLTVTSGPNVVFNQIDCLTYRDDPSFLDELVHTWGNCDAASASPLPRSSATIGSANWIGGVRGETYHPQYNIKFTPAILGDPEYYVEFTGKEYLVDELSNTYWL
ncbi:hypothetical protein FHU41_000345 [Psychromicrobium silvestre]|uniref:Uncharacterized protein n=1 Tax=Psychromicrobium silvestre TaxID=1645614 RepID=A0A7Y9LR93_9MICC|nr:hypothetical protein [Psychromicrobium silvestre]NYE94124.1 hypothetical protein [Psychromicrobium silvestre]